MRAPPRSGFRSLTPRIVANDPAGLVSFLRAAFDAEGEWHSGRPAEMRIGDSTLMVSETNERDAHSAFLYIYVDDADARYGRALALGATSLEAPFDTPYGDRRAMIRDPFDTVWQIAHVLADAEVNATPSRNKTVVVRFNRECIEQGNEAAFAELLAPEFVNRTAAPGVSPGPDGMIFMVNRVLRPAFPDLTVDIHEKVEEGDLVCTQKTIRGTHRGDLFGIPATNQPVEIQVMDMVRVEHGKYVEHWGVNTLSAVLAELRAASSS